MIENLFSLKGRTALVTGGSRGIGKMIAHGFLESGAKVYISSRKADACDATAAELSKYGNCISLPQDVSTVAGCKALAEQIYKLENGKLDILVNNAGAAWAADFDEFPEHGWDKVMNLNVKSPFFLTQALHAALAKAASEAQPAKVINICSIDGITLNPLETYSYHASKASLIYLTRRMAARLVQDKIVVTGIAPGPFPSEMNRAARDQEALVASRTPLRRVGRDEDMAGLAIFLASKAGDYVVGDTIASDGGIAYANLPARDA
jgi:NAD(P)-dependent dehydrogenase (short-subunit alcohol dehydrogenase family)